MNITEKIVSTLVNFKSRCRHNSKSGCETCAYSSLHNVWQCLGCYISSEGSMYVYTRLIPIIREIEETCMSEHTFGRNGCSECKYSYGMNTAMCCISQALYVECGVDLFDHLLDRYDLIEEDE